MFHKQKVLLEEAIPLNDVSATCDTVLRFQSSLAGASGTVPTGCLRYAVGGAQRSVEAKPLFARQLNGRARAAFVFSAEFPKDAGGCTFEVTRRGTFGEKHATLTLDSHDISEALECRRAAREHAQEAPHHAWMLSHQPTAAELDQQRAEVATWPADQRPLISIVTPVYRPDPAYLREMIGSVLAQTYPHLELVLANASGDCPEVDAVLASLDDPRVRVLAIPNVDISQNTNVAIAAATGDYVAFVDHDDLIEPDALYRYVSMLREHPTCDLAFCDEDLYEETEAGWRYTGPRFKPGWNPDLLYTHNYVCHLLMVSRRALELTERSGSDVNAAQDYDLTLKAAEVARDIFHVPKLLYHWRVHRASTAINRDSKPYALEAGRLAVAHHFERLGIPVDVVLGAYPFSYRPICLPANPPVSASVLVACPHADEVGLERALRSVRGTNEYPADRYEVVVAVPRDFQRAAEQVAQEVLASQPEGTAEVHVETVSASDASSLLNAAAAAAHNDVLVLLDDRSETVAPYWLYDVVSPLYRPEVGATGMMLTLADGLIEAHGMVLRADGSLGRRGRALEITDPGYMSMLFHARDCSVLPARGLAIRHASWEELGGLDASMGALAVADLCLKLRERGSLVVSEPYGALRVYEQMAGDETPAERARLMAAHPSFATGDEYLNPHVDPWSDNFALRDKEEA